MTWIAGIFISYLMGSIPTAYLVGRVVSGIDIRKFGSGNAGATNVFRVVGKKWGLGVLFFDLFKGFFSAFWLPRYFTTPHVSFFVMSLIFGIAAIAGHTWTIWLGLRGGKGVATSAGAFLALAPKASGAAFLVWILLLGLKRYVSLASLGTAVSFPFFVYWFYRESDFFKSLFPISLALTLFIFYTHRDNLRRLRQGGEKKIF